MKEVLGAFRRQSDVLRSEVTRRLRELEAGIEAQNRLLAEREAERLDRAALRARAEGGAA